MLQHHPDGIDASPLDRQKQPLVRMQVGIMKLPELPVSVNTNVSANHISGNNPESD